MKQFRKILNSVLSPQSSVLLSSRFDRFCDLCLDAGPVALLIFTPLAFGSVHVWTFSLVEISVFFLVMVWMGQILLRLPNRQWHSLPVLPFSRSPVLPLFLFLGLVLFQLLPLPPGLLQILSPSTHQLYQTALPNWPQQEPFVDHFAVKMQHPAPNAVAVTEVGTSESPLTQHSALSTQHSAFWLPLSVYPHASREELLKLLAYFAFFTLVVLRSFPLPIVFTLISAGTGLALLAFVQHATWNGKLLWFFIPYDWQGSHPGSEDRLHGPFVNTSHFAGYLEMIVPLAVAATLIAGRRLWREAGVKKKNVNESLPLSLGERGRVRGEKALFYTLITQTNALFSLQALSFGFFVLAATAILTAIVLTLSRGGFIAAFASLFFMAWLLWPRTAQPSVFSPQSPRLPYALLVKLGRLACVLGVFSVPMIYLEYTQAFVRFQQISRDLEVDRPVIYVATLALWRDFPIFGVGLGNFQEVFPRYQPSALGKFFCDYAHNDYLQLLAETGVVGFVLLMWALGSMLYKAARSWRRVSGEQRLWLAGVLAGIVAMLLHSLVDFNLHIPSNALLFVTLLALSVRLGRWTMDGRP